MIDLHTHILYHLDDGAKNQAETLAMLRQAVDDGIHTLFATPHYIHGAISTAPGLLMQRLEEVKQLAQAHDLPITLLPGTEIALDEHTPEALAQGLALPLNNSRYVLVELPFSSLSPHTANILAQLTNHRYIPIIAHPERCDDVVENPEVLEPFLQLGCLLQLNAGSITGENGRQSQQLAKNLLMSRRAHFVASDAHSPRRRKPVLSEARRMTAQWLGEQGTHHIFVNNPEAVLSNKELSVPAPLTYAPTPSGVMSRILQYLTT